GRKTPASHALIEIPSGEIPRFVTLPEYRGKTIVMYLDDIIRFGLPGLFAGLPYDRFDAWAIKFTRDAEIELDEDITERFYDKMAEGVRARQEGEAVRMNYDSRIPAPFLKLLIRKLNFGEEDTLLPGHRYHNRRDLAQFPVPARLLHPPFLPQPHTVLRGPA